MADGSWKNIEDLFIGDEIMTANVPGVPDDEISEDYISQWSSLDISATSKVPGYVVSVQNRSFNQYYKINNMVNVTYEHRIPAQQNGVWKFITVEELMVGDNIMDHNLEIVPVLTKELIIDFVNTTSIDTDVKDIYFVKGLMAHNIIAPKDQPA